MEYKQEIIQKMLQDRRYDGIITKKKKKVWKNRGIIPDKYLNPTFIELYKQGYIERANLVKDPYFNENLHIKYPLTPSQKVLQERLIEIVSSKKVNSAEVIRQTGIKHNFYADAIRENQKKQVDMKGDELISLKKNINLLRLKVRKVITPLIGKNEFTQDNVNAIDNLFMDRRLVVLHIINQNSFYRTRIYSRQVKRMTLFDNEEIKFYIHCLIIFTAETAI